MQNDALKVEVIIIYKESLKDEPRVGKHLLYGLAL